MVTTVANCVLSVDIGSGGVRVRAHNRAFQTLAGASVPIETDVGEDGASVQNTRQVMDAVTVAVRRVAAEPHLSVHAITASGTASSLVLPDSDQRAAGSPPDGTVLLWSDTRAHRFGAQLAAELTDAYDRTICPPDPSYWPAKICWAQDNGISAHTRFAGVKDVLFQSWTGLLWTDPMTAAATGLFDSREWQWDAPLTHRLGLDESRLPGIHPATESAPLTAAAAEVLGLPRGLPVVLGGMDGPLTQLGAAGFDKGIASCTIGTSIAYRAGLDHRTVDGLQRVWCYPVTPQHWVIGGAGSNGGNILTWLQQTWAAGTTLGETLAAGFSVANDPDLTFVPYLNGERAPVWRSDLRAAFVGLTARHRPAHIARAALTGVMAAAIELADAVTALAGPSLDVRLSGGFIQESRWVQLLTDALGRPTAVPNPATATSTGLALLAWAALDNLPLDKVFQPSAGPSIQPDLKTHTELRRAAARVTELRQVLWPA